LKAEECLSFNTCKIVIPFTPYKSEPIHTHKQCKEPTCSS